MVSLRVYDCKKQAEAYLVYDEELRKRDGGADMAVSSSGYTSKEIMSMQQDAIRRVNEMQRIAREKIANSENRSQNFAKPQEKPTPQQNQQNNKPLPPMKPPPNIVKPNEPSKELVKAENKPTEVLPYSLAGFLDRMNIDTETLLLIGLLLLLINEGADVQLLMALVYILL